MQEYLSALVIHDIKNSLALLELELEQLNHHADLPVEARQAYRRCVELKGRLMSFLTLYKQEHGGIQADIREVEVLRFLEDLIVTSQSVQMGGRKHGRELQVVVAESRIQIAPDIKLKGIANFDENLLDLALESALSNAVRYARSRVEIWFDQSAQGLIFHVQDDGPGVGLDHGVAQRSKSENASSTGLGLALCQAVADAHGEGSVTLVNASGGGALFSIGFRDPVGRPAD